MSARYSFWCRIGWKQAKTLEIEAGRVLGTEMLRVCNRGTKLGDWAEFVFGG